MTQATIHEAKTQLSRLIAEVESGGEVVVCRGKQPVAKIVPYRGGGRTRPEVGKITSKPIHYAADCFAPLSGKELKEWGL